MYTHTQVLRKATSSAPKRMHRISNPALTPIDETPATRDVIQVSTLHSIPSFNISFTFLSIQKLSKVD